MNINNRECNLPFEFIFDQFPASLWCMDKDHIYRGGNPAAWRAAGVSSLEEFYGKSVRDFAKNLNWTQSKTEDFYNFDEEMIRTGTESTDIHDVIWQGGLMNQVGAKKPYFDKNGKVMGLLGIGIPNKLINEKIIYTPSNDSPLLNKNSSDLSCLSNWEIFEKAPASLWCIDRNHTFRCCNDFACRLIGAKSQKEVYGKNIIELAKYNNYNWPPHVAQSIYDFDENLFKTRSHALTTSNILPQGKEAAPVHLSGIKVPVFNEDDEVIALLGAEIVVNPFRAMYTNKI